MLKKILISLILCILLAGCNMLGPRPHDITKGLGEHVPSSAVTSLKVNWLFSLFMIAAVLGIVAGLQGMKSGWAIAVGNIGGIVLSLAVAEYGRWLAIGGIIAGVLVVAAMILRNRQFQFQSVKSVEELKEALPELKGKINDVFFHQQTKTTEKIVQAVKSKLTKEQQRQELLAREEARKKRLAFFEKQTNETTEEV